MGPLRELARQLAEGTSLSIGEFETKDRFLGRLKEAGPDVHQIDLPPVVVPLSMLARPALGQGSWAGWSPAPVVCRGGPGQLDRIEVELGESPAAPANDTSVWAIGDSLALRPGLPQLVQQHLAPGDAPGRANRGDKLVTLVASALAGGDGINDADMLCQRRRKQGGGRGRASAEVHRRQVVRCGRSKEAAPDLLRRRKKAASPDAM